MADIFDEVGDVFDQAATVKKERPVGYDASQTIDGVPAWGRAHPNVYAGVQTGLDLLPMTAAFAGGPVAGMATAGMLNMARGAAQRGIAGEDSGAMDYAKDAGYGVATEGLGRARAGLLWGYDKHPPQPARPH